MTMFDCGWCDGMGVVDGWECSLCGGTGVHYEEVVDEEEALDDDQ